MAESILSALTSSVQFKVNSTDGAVKANLKVSKVSFKFRSDPKGTIMEDGTTKVDAKILLPTECNVQVYCQSVDDLRQVNDLLRNRSKLFTVSSKGVIIENAVLEVEHLDQSPDVMSAYPINLRFMEIILQEKKPVIVGQAADAKGISAGLASITQKATQTVSGLVSAVKASAANVARQVTKVL